MTRNAVILAHNYQRPEVQDIADFVGDSLGLSQQAAATDASVIVFCGVHFMAETAAILSPEQAPSCCPTSRPVARWPTPSHRSAARWRAEHPGAVVVSYVNTTAEVKAAVGLLLHLVQRRVGDPLDPRSTRDLFLPGHVPRCARWSEQTGREKMHVWMGECHVHAGIVPERLDAMRQEHLRRGAARPPRVRLHLVDAAIGCRPAASPARRTVVTSTEGMVQQRRRIPGLDVHRRHRGRHPAPHAASSRPASGSLPRRRRRSALI